MLLGGVLVFHIKWVRAYTYYYTLVIFSICYFWSQNYATEFCHYE